MIKGTAAYELGFIEGSRNPKKVCILGEKKNGEWQLKGVFSSMDLAISEAKGRDYFVTEVVVDEPETVDEWPEAAIPNFAPAKNKADGGYIVSTEEEAERLRESAKKGDIDLNNKSIDVLSDYPFVEAEDFGDYDE